jgi:hypothetical protein
MEYKEWVRLERQHPWLWAIVSGRNAPSRSVVFLRASRENPFNRHKPFPDSRFWIVSGIDRGFLQPWVTEVVEIAWGNDNTLRDQVRKSGWSSETPSVYVVVGTLRSYSEGENLIIYKRPHGVTDLRPLLM